MNISARNTAFLGFVSALAHETFDDLPAAQQSAMVMEYLIESDGRGREPATEFEAKRFFRALRADELRNWL